MIDQNLGEQQWGIRKAKQDDVESALNGRTLFNILPFCGSANDHNNVVRFSFPLHRVHISLILLLALALADDRLSQEILRFSYFTIIHGSGMALQLSVRSPFLAF